MTEDRKPRPNFNNGLGGFPPGYKRIEIYPEEEMTIETVHDLTDTNVAHLQDFKEFLQNKIIPKADEGMEELGDLDGISEQIAYREFRDIIKEAEEYTNHINALLKDHTEEEMTVETVHDLTDTNVAHLQDFKEFLKKNILNEGQIVMISLQAVNDTVKEEFGRDECMGSISMRHIIRKCEEYITHIDALLLGK